MGDGPVPLLPGFHFHQTASNSDLQCADTLVVPACLDVHEAPPPELVDVVRSAYRRGARILSICSGAFVLDAAGILDGRRATTHWLHADELARRYPAVTVDPTVLYIEDGNICAHRQIR